MGGFGTSTIRHFLDILEHILAKLTPEQLEEVQKAYETYKLSNMKIALMFAKYKVSEKNVRDWAKKYGWIKGKFGKGERAKDRREERKKEKSLHRQIFVASKDKETEEVERRINLAEDELEETIHIINDMSVAGYTKRQIKKFLEEKANINDDVLDAIYDVAMDRFESYVSKNLVARIGWHIRAKMMLYRNLVKEKKWEQANKILDAMMKLEGLVPDRPLVNINTFDNGEVVYEIPIPEEYLAFRDVIEMKADDGKREESDS